uniref:J domain-containing protein n=1 Tax=Amorphochlora amoebiformis TaxID=1561963 RepID=A0A7S0GPP9_9EUKA|mmetsp:Transcript_13075/g.20738  ORF Transcript_13075/g.20738 Transcript_13075/m.20738 type:complete len:543 (+) Transcript_13075:161-1789(+)
MLSNEMGPRGLPDPLVWIIVFAVIAFLPVSSRERVWELRGGYRSSDGLMSRRRSRPGVMGLRGGASSKRKYSKPAERRNKVFPFGNKGKSLNRGMPLPPTNKERFQQDLDEYRKQKKAFQDPVKPQRPWKPLSKPGKENEKPRKRGYRTSFLTDKMHIGKEGRETMKEVVELAGKKKWATQKDVRRSWQGDKRKVASWRIDKPWGDLYGKNNLKSSQDRKRRKRERRRAGLSTDTSPYSEDSDAPGSKKWDIEEMARKEMEEKTQRTFYIDGFEGGVRFQDGYASFESPSKSVDIAESDQEYRDLERQATVEQESKLTNPHEAWLQSCAMAGLKPPDEDDTGGVSSTKSKSKRKAKPYQPKWTEKKPSTSRKKTTTRAVVVENVVYYEVLGIGRNASVKEITKAFRRKAVIMHPDKFPAGQKSNAEKAFKELEIAYTALTNPHRRHIYDTYGAKGLQKLDEGYNDEQIKNECSQGYRDHGSDATDIHVSDPAKVQYQYGYPGDMDANQHYSNAFQEFEAELGNRGKEIFSPFGPEDAFLNNG